MVKSADTTHHQQGNVWPTSVTAVNDQSFSFILNINYLLKISDFEQIFFANWRIVFVHFFS